jgi:hypothetical protein
VSRLQHATSIRDAESRAARCRAGHCYDIQRAGRAIGSADLHLDPFPLLASGGSVKVALHRSSTRAPFPLNRSSPCEMMPVSLTLLSILCFGFLLGMRHAFDADHVVAVSTIVNRRRASEPRHFDRHLLGRRSRTHHAWVGRAIVLSGSRSSARWTPASSWGRVDAHRAGRRE